MLLEIILNKILVSDTILYSIELWSTTILPSLFPFFILSDILIKYNITDYIPKWIKNIFYKLFKLSKYSLSIFFLSLISGFPSNARNTKQYYQNKLITKEEASNILAFTHFSNPIFILSTISVFFLHNALYGKIILISHYIGNIIIGLIFRNKNNYPTKINYTKDNIKSQNFSIVLTNAITSSIDTLLLIFGTLTCFLILSSLIINYINLPPYESSILKCILEITMGINSLSKLPINDIYKVIISTMAISFGGLSVHMQVISQISDTDISYIPFLIGRILHLTISGIISYILFILIA